MPSINTNVPAETARTYSNGKALEALATQAKLDLQRLFNEGNGPSSITYPAQSAPYVLDVVRSIDGIRLLAVIQAASVNADNPAYLAAKTAIEIP
jgi:hypothetical protein